MPATEPELMPSESTFKPALMLMTGRALAFAITFFVPAVLARVFTHTEFGGNLRFDTTVLREQLGYALPLFCAVALNIIQQNYHQYAVSWHFDAATFAIYSVGCLQIPLVDFMATPASNVMMVQMGEDLRERRHPRLPAVWHDTTRTLARIKNM